MLIKNKFSFTKAILFCMVTFLNVTAQANSNVSEQLENVASEWVQIKYDTATTKRDRLKAFETLAEKTKAIVHTYPGDAKAHMWHGVVMSTYASVRGGRAALKMVDEAKNSLEKSIELSGSAPESFAHAVLGALYHRVPGWPLSFKDMNVAKSHLDIAMRIAPDSVDNNFYYGDYLAETKDLQSAEKYLRVVLSSDIDTPLVNGRKTEARESLGKILKINA